MIFLLNRERVLAEVLELTRLKIAQALKVDAGKVNARAVFEDGKIRPEFDVDVETKALEGEYLQKEIAQIWRGQMLPLMQARLSQIDEGRIYAEAGENAPDCEAARA